MAKRKRLPALPEEVSELDIVIPVYGRPDLLKECLAAIPLAGFDVNYKLFLVDDKSPEPGPLEILYNSLNSQARIIRNPQNMGFPAAANRGAAQGHAPAILFLNSDVVLKPNALRIMLNSLWSSQIERGIFDPPDIKGVGIVAPKLLFPEGGHDQNRPGGKVQHVGIAFNGAGKPFHALIGWSSDNPKVNIKRSLQAVSGACLLIRRALFDQIWRGYQAVGDPSAGGFNEVYGLGTYEDIELSFAVRSLGYQVLVEPRAVGYHYVGGSAAAQPGGYPLGRNENIFRARCGQLILWDEWAVW